MSSGTQKCNAEGNGLEECICAAGTGTGDTSTDDTSTGGDDTGTGGTEDTATGETTDDTGTCLQEFEKQCVGQAIYWFDSCGEQGDFVADCVAQGGCQNAECQGECTPKVEKKCHEGDPWWFDSCGEPQTGAEICTDEQFCVNAACVKPFYNGTWELTADPDTKDFSLGTATFPPTLMELTIDGTSATGELVNFIIDVTYEGELTGKVLKMDASYDGPSGDHHEEEVTVTFSDPKTFYGNIVDKITADLGLGPTPLGTLIWQVTGVKQ